MNKRIQKEWMQAAGMLVPNYVSFKRTALQELRKSFNLAKKTVGLPFVVKPANQGSSVGVSVINDEQDIQAFEKALQKAFFIQTITAKDWISKTKQEKAYYLQKITDVKEGVGLPAFVNQKLVYHPDELYKILESQAKKGHLVHIESIYSETEVLIESFIEGREFSCIVLRNEDGSAVALPPTEIVKGSEGYDYKSKYLPGRSRKVTPIDLEDAGIQKIRKACEKLFTYFNFHVYARIDGFLGKDGSIFLNDPNTTSGMMPSSFFFHQAAEIGLNPSQFLTYIIRTSLKERANSQSVFYQHEALLAKLNKQLSLNKSKKASKKRVAVFMGGYSTERHISVESGRNIFEKLASSDAYQPFPVFVTGNDEAHQLYLLPIHVMLKDNADDIKEKVMHYHRPTIMQKIEAECKDILDIYSVGGLFEPREISYKELKKMADAVFIALHGRPGEDGTVQTELNKLKIPFNGSDVASSQITINKFDTNALLKKKGFLVAEHYLVEEEAWQTQADKIIAKIEKIGYPLIAKPADDGCSSAVKKIKTRAELENYAKGVFRPQLEISPELRSLLMLSEKEEFPKKRF